MKLLSSVSILLMGLSSSFGAISMQVQVSNVTESSATLRFVMEGAANNLSGGEAAVPYGNMLFISLTGSSALQAALDLSDNYDVVAATNTLSTTDDIYVSTLEMRVNGESDDWARMSLVFDSQLSATSAFAEGAGATFVLPITGSLTASDFDGLSVYWSWGYLIDGVGDTPIGTTSGIAVPEPSTYALAAGGLTLAFLLVRRRRS